MSALSVSFLIRQHKDDLAQFGLWTGYFFSINVVVGSGFLALPYSFNRSGWLLALIFMVLIAFLCYILASQTLEVMSRVECIKQLEDIGIYIPNAKIKHLFLGGYPKQDIPDEIQPEVTGRRFDLSTMAGILFGRNYGRTYMVFLYLFMTLAQVGYISIFSSSFAAKIPLGFSDSCDIYEDKELFGSCRKNYWFFLIIYSCFMMYLTIKGLKEQKWLQSALTIMRFVIIFIIVSTSIALLATSSNIKNSDHVSYKFFTFIGILTYNFICIYLSASISKYSWIC